MAVTSMKRVRIDDAALSKGRIQGEMLRLVRGVLPPEFFGVLVIPEYQRKAMGKEKRAELTEALNIEEEGATGVPDDMLLCVRTDKVSSLGVGQLYVHTNEIIVLDGHQRWDTLEALLRAGKPIDPIGCKILLGTTEAVEVSTFYQINRKHTQVSTDVHLRNSGKNAAILVLQKLELTDPDFPRINWDQGRDSRTDISWSAAYDILKKIVMRGLSLFLVFLHLVKVPKSVIIVCDTGC